MKRQKNLLNYGTKSPVRSFVFKESMELHRISLLLFNLMIVRLVAEGNALALKLL